MSIYQSIYCVYCTVFLVISTHICDKSPSGEGGILFHGLRAHRESPGHHSDGRKRHGAPRDAATSRVTMLHDSGGADVPAAPRDRAVRRPIGRNFRQPRPNESWVSSGAPMSALEPTPVANPRIWTLPPVTRRRHSFRGAVDVECVHLASHVSTDNEASPLAALFPDLFPGPGPLA